jgi:hypothetical protein
MGCITWRFSFEELSLLGISPTRKRTFISTGEGMLLDGPESDVQMLKHGTFWGFNTIGWVSKVGQRGVVRRLVHQSWSPTSETT